MSPGYPVRVAGYGGDPGLARPGGAGPLHPQQEQGGARAGAGGAHHPQPAAAREPLPAHPAHAR